MFSEDWTKLEPYERTGEYMTQSAQNPKQQYTLFKEHQQEQQFRNSTSSSPYLRAVHKHVPISDTRRNTTDLEVESTLDPLGLCRIKIPPDGACMVGVNKILRRKHKLN